MSAVVHFITPAEQALEDTERLVEVVGNLAELGARLAALEKTLVEAAGADPLATINARLDVFEAKLAALELRQRRPTPLTVVQNHQLDPDEREIFLELQRLFNTLDREVKQHARNADSRASHYAGQFRMIRERLAAVERKGATT